MIETYKILNKLYDERVAPDLMQSFVIRTRGHNFKLKKKWLNVTYGNIPLLKE